MAARVSEAGGGRKTPSQCKMRWERIVNPDVKRGLWTKEEDDKLKQVAAAMDHKWSHVSLTNTIINSVSWVQHDAVRRMLCMAGSVPTLMSLQPKELLNRKSCTCIMLLVENIH